jgi:PHD/YefM family antitoxin component YafN of YafNO toxin-antitoxin module
MPITTAARKGVSAVAASAEKERVVLTSHGRTVAVVDSAERLDESIRTVREAAGAVLDWAASQVSERGERLTLDEVCARIGVDPELVRERARQRIAAGA